jgi:hypothetical protein
MAAIVAQTQPELRCDSADDKTSVRYHIEQYVLLRHNACAMWIR